MEPDMIFNFEKPMNHPNRKAAKMNGNLKYFTGHPCKNGHLSERWVTGGNCVECIKIARNKHKTTDKFKTTTKAYSKNYRSKLIHKLYGLTEIEYDDILKSQNYQCKLCEANLKLDRTTHIDHCHNTNKVRGILCHNCNVGLGHFKHNSVLIRKAAVYCE